MKKTRLIPSILMLILCISVLCIGIYAVTPTTNNIIGTINLTAANPEVEITAYLGTDKSTQISDTVTGRKSKTINLYANSLEFVEPEGTNAIADLTLVVEVKNNSTAVDVGAFFLNGAILPETITSSHVLRSATYDGVNESKTTTVEDIMAISFPAYTKVAKGATVDLVCTLSVEELYEEELTSSIELPLVIHEYQSSLASVAIQVSSYEVSGTEETSAGTITGSGSFAVGNQITLTANPSNYNAATTYTYTWYAKNSFGNWEVVTDSDSDDSTYTFTLSATSQTEYKVVYTSQKSYVVKFTYENQFNNIELTLSGAGEKELGDEVVLTIGGPVLAEYNFWAVNWYAKENGSWVLIQSKEIFNPTTWSDSYTFNVEDGTPLEYNVIISSPDMPGMP